MTDSSYQTLVEYLIDLIPRPDTVVNQLIFSAFLLFVLTMLFLYIKNKAKSGFSISNLLWGLVFRHKVKKGDLINDIIEIEKFNFCYNTFATSLREKRQFERWVRKYELNFRYIAKLKRYFNIETLKVKKMKRRIPISVVTLSLLFLFSSIPTSIVAFKPAGLIKVYDSGWFWYNKNEAIEYDFLASRKNVWIITPKNCGARDKVITQSGLSKDVVNTICDSFPKPNVEVYINDLIKKQRYFFGFIVFLFAAMFLYLFREFIKQMFTYDTRNMICIKIKKYRKRRNSKILAK